MTNMDKSFWYFYKEHQKIVVLVTEVGPVMAKVQAVYIHDYEADENGNSTMGIEPGEVFYWPIADLHPTTQATTTIPITL
jgi:hypothetical protein